MATTPSPLSPLVYSTILATASFFPSQTHCAFGAEETAQHSTSTESPKFSRSIPTDSIWYYGSVGKMSLRRLEPNVLVFRDTPENIKKHSSPEAITELREKAKQSLVLKIEEALRDLPDADPKISTAPGFIVRGVAREALPGIVDVLVKKKDPGEKFSTKDDLSLVFFIHPTGFGAGIESVEIKDTTIHVTYCLTSSSSLLISPGLYLIPLGKLPPGNYAVEMARSSNEASRNQPGFPAVPAKVEKYTVCKPFDFIVSE